ncbi:MAG: alanine racemase [Christensenellales bacterium]|jgi:alanine racemase
MDILRPTYAEIDLGCIRRNTTALKRACGGAMLMAVVKANAYGHGMIRSAKAALSGGASWLAVTMAEEGIELREAGISASVCVIGGMSAGAGAKVVEYGMSQAIFTRAELDELQYEAARRSVKAKAHLKIDTGMSRIGVRVGEELEALLDAWDSCPDVEMEGVFTHFATSDAEDKAFSHKQADLFEQATNRVRQRGHNPIRHAANSAAVLDLPDTHYDMVRAGISLYGYYPSECCNKDVTLEPAMTWKSKVIYTKQMRPGDGIGYGLTYKAPSGSVIATVPAGYGDGYMRLLSNKADVLIGGKRARVRGRVCMDQLMADVTGIDGVKPGDEVVLIGRQGSEYIGADELAELAGTICYETLLTVSARVPRVFVGE